MPRLQRMTTKSIDWSQLWYPGRKQPFSASEMARSGSDPPSPTLVVISALNFAVMAFVVLQLAPASHTAVLSAALVALAVMAAALVHWLWWRPWRKPLMQAQLGVMLMMLLLATGLRWRLPERADREFVAVVMSVGGIALVVALWFVAVWRAQQIESRLAEQAERARAIDMARRLAAAQIEPHFLFNTLASVQHWAKRFIDAFIQPTPCLFAEHDCQ